MNEKDKKMRNSCMKVNENKIIALMGSIAIFLMIMNSSTIYSYYFETISITAIDFRTASIFVKEYLSASRALMKTYSFFCSAGAAGILLLPFATPRTLKADNTIVSNMVINVLIINNGYPSKPL